MELVGWIYNELKEKWASVHHMDVYIDGIDFFLKSSTFSAACVCFFLPLCV